MDIQIAVTQNSRKVWSILRKQEEKSFSNCKDMSDPESVVIIMIIVEGFCKKSLAIDFNADDE